MFDEYRQLMCVLHGSESEASYASFCSSIEAGDTAGVFPCVCGSCFRLKISFALVLNKWHSPFPLTSRCPHAWAGLTLPATMPHTLCSPDTLNSCPGGSQAHARTLQVVIAGAVNNMFSSQTDGTTHNMKNCYVHAHMVVRALHCCRSYGSIPRNCRCVRHAMTYIKRITA